MEKLGGSILFYCNKSRYVFGLALCLACSAFAVYVIITMAEFKWLALAALLFFLYKSGLNVYELFLNKKTLVELKEKEILIDGCPPLSFKAIEAVGQKRVNIWASNQLYVCLKTDESKFNLTDLQKENISLGLTAFCFRPAALSRKDADFLIKSILSKTKSN